MAITDIRQYVHLTAADIEELGRELDAIRVDIEESRGEPDARYVHRTIQLQRGLAAGGRRGLRTALRELQTGDVATSLSSARRAGQSSSR